ncbi:MAG: hypothetical protein K0R09_2405 [Clostridiales bacterium]|nr:hypothetical protein [Clostridiales bacterium]
MKRLFAIGLVVMLTIISVFAMTTVRGSDIQEEPVFIEDEEEDYGKPEGTGYMFDDYDKGINIPFEKEEEKVESKKDNSSSQIEQEKFRRVAERNMALLEDIKKSSSLPKKSYRVAYNSKNNRSKSKDIISKVQNNISFEDKLSLIKIVKSLSLGELNDIKNAIINGTTNAESIKLWTMLRNKLPDDEYKRLENIIAKYE